MRGMKTVWVGEQLRGQWSDHRVSLGLVKSLVYRIPLDGLGFVGAAFVSRCPFVCHLFWFHPEYLSPRFWVSSLETDVWFSDSRLVVLSSDLCWVLISFLSVSLVFSKARAVAGWYLWELIGPKILLRRKVFLGNSLQKSLIQEFFLDWAFHS